MKFFQRSYEEEILSHPLIKQIRKREMSQVLPFIQKHLEPSNRILEVGCGSGFYTKELMTTYPKIVGIDKDPNIVKERPNLPLKQGDLFKLTSQDFKEFDSLILLGVMEFFNAEEIESCFNHIFPHFTKIIIMVPSKGIRSFPYRFTHLFKNRIILGKITRQDIPNHFSITEKKVFPFNKLFLLETSHKD